MYTGKKSTNQRKGMPEQKFDAAFGFFINSKCLQGSKQKLHINFSLY
jgi:hypothetical protein